MQGRSVLPASSSILDTVVTGQMQGSEPALHFAVNGGRTGHTAGSAISSKPSRLL